MSDFVSRRKSPFVKALSFFFLIVVGGYILIWLVSGKIGDVNTISGRERLAIIKVEGVIIQSDDIVRQLKKYGNDDSIKGILIRINSPGGGVGASQEIYKEILNTKHKKKIVASMGGLAASGGYYIACAADRIVANPGTITGSIGVIMAFSNIEELLKKLGMKSVTIKSGKYKDIGSPTKKMSKEERDILQQVSDDIHDQFIEAVAKGRNLDIEQVRTVADGRILSGRQALKAGLVDQLGNKEDAIKDLSKLAAIKGKPIIVEESMKKNMLYKFLSGEILSKIFYSQGISWSGAQYL